MKQARIRSSKPLHRTHAVCDRRADHRVPIDVRLMYSAQDDTGALIMGDGAVVDISNAGMKIRGNTAVQPDLEMTLFVYLPDGRDPLFIMNARVAWSTGHEFGVVFLKMNIRERNRLRYFLCSNLERNEH
jgi:hypothetical protein